MDVQWHYKDEKNGKRLGPVGRDDIQRLIADDRIERASLVWHPAMPDWACASTTELVDLFGEKPPPIPASAISRWAIYVLALVPLWGIGIQAAASYLLADPAQLSPSDLFAHKAWILFYIVANSIFGILDERNLERAGLKIRGAAVVSAVLAPAYIIVSCRRVARHAGRGGWLAYTPVLLWFIAFAGSIYADANVQELFA